MSTAPTTPESRPVDDDCGVETPKMAHDSLVTVRLSEPPTLTLDTSVAMSPAPPLRQAHTEESIDEPDKETEERKSAELATQEASALETPTDAYTSENLFLVAVEKTPTPARIMREELGGTGATVDDDDNDDAGDDADADADAKSDSDTASITPTEEANHDADEDEVDWDQLQKSEDQETKTDDTDNSTAMLLARLEQENAKLATNPKSAKPKVAERLAKKLARQSRPPSMAQIKDMMTGPAPPALRYSMIPPPPMTDLEFYAALVKDYPQTAARLPTLLSNKIRKGIPPPLRGVVWQSMSGARDIALEEQYERLTGESSPHEPIIIKDLSRTFPGVDMFRDAEGDGQRMLGRVLKCYSIYDPKIGYCQGLAFLVGPLLMHMLDKAAFCVLVRLMERYDLRSCFLPDLPGLHVRIYQFRELLKHVLPTLSAHLDELQVDPAYVSQWFLSFFAVTAPLSMLFRVYDVIFAEGASESLMRVALCLMRKNQSRLLACAELEDAMQLLLSRGLWDCYNYNVDEFVRDFVGLTGIVTREELHRLQQEYKESQQQPASGANANANAARASAITSAASRFLGRIWSSPKVGATNPTSTLSPSTNPPPSRPFSMLRRSTSKQSLASTLNSMEASSVSVVSTASTAATSRDSSAAPDDDCSARNLTSVHTSAGSAKANGDRYLHSQIEDLLTALSELQRHQALLIDELQREREDREDDSKVVIALLDRLQKQRNGEVSDDENIVHDEASNETVGLGISIATSLTDLVVAAELRFNSSRSSRPPSIVGSKDHIREELAKTKDQLATAVSQLQNFGRKIHDLDETVVSLKDQLRDSHAHVRILHQEKQRLEKQVRAMRVRASAASENNAARDSNERPASATSAASGLRQLKLGRSKSTPTNPTPYVERTSSTSHNRESTLGVPAHAATMPSVPDEQDETLLLELVQAKTAEAIAKQEAEEAKQKLENFKKQFGLVGDHGQNNMIVKSSAASPHSVGALSAISSSSATVATSSGAGGAIGMFGRFTGGGLVSEGSKPVAPISKQTAAPSAPAAIGSFWSGWRK